MTDTLLPPVATSVPSPRIALEVRERPISNRSSVLDISYDGSQPPDELFAALRALGWRDAVATTPRADVIEWGVPDPARGTNYSVRPHVAVVHATLHADVERCQEVRRRTRELLAGHGPLSVDDGTEAPDGARAPADPGTATGAVLVIVEVLCPHPSAPGVEAAAASFGELLGRDDVTEVVTSTFRGNVTEVVLPLRRVRLRVPAARHEELVSLLSTMGARRVAIVG